jgi:hypothetical protein
MTSLGAPTTPSRDRQRGCFPAVPTAPSPSIVSSLSFSAATVAAATTATAPTSNNRLYIGNSPAVVAGPRLGISNTYVHNNSNTNKRVLDPADHQLLLSNKKSALPNPQLPQPPSSSSFAGNNTQSITAHPQQQNKDDSNNINNLQIPRSSMPAKSLTGQHRVGSAPFSSPTGESTTTNQLSSTANATTTIANTTATTRTPLRSASKQDRFIPNRTALDMDYNYFRLMKDNNDNDVENNAPVANQDNTSQLTPSQRKFHSELHTSLLKSPEARTRIVECRTSLTPSFDRVASSGQKPANYSFSEHVQVLFFVCLYLIVRLFTCLFTHSTKQQLPRRSS